MSFFKSVQWYPDYISVWGLWIFQDSAWIDFQGLGIFFRLAVLEPGIRALRSASQLVLLDLATFPGHCHGAGHPQCLQGCQPLSPPLSSGFSTPSRPLWRMSLPSCSSLVTQQDLFDQPRLSLKTGKRTCLEQLSFFLFCFVLLCFVLIEV